jgi:hypothetical protein
MTGISQDLQTMMAAAGQLARGAAELGSEAAAVKGIEDLVDWQGANNIALEILRETYIFATSWIEEVLVQDQKVLQYAADQLKQWVIDMGGVEASMATDLGRLAEKLQNP